MEVQLTAHQLALIAEYSEARAMLDMFNAAPPGFASGAGLRVTPFDSAIALTAKNIDMVLFNRVLGLGFYEKCSEQLISDLVEHFQAYGASHYGIQISPLFHTPELTGWLEEQGLTKAASWAKLLRDTREVEPIESELTVRRIDAKQAGLWAEVFCAAYAIPPLLVPMVQTLVGRPGWYHYLAFDHNEAIGTGAMYSQEGIGWLGLDSTLPTHRGRGAQNMIINKRIADGYKLGCHWLVSETNESTSEHPDSSYNNYIRQGFQRAYLRPSYEPRVNRSPHMLGGENERSEYDGIRP
jgi:hypothetical protein